MASLMAPLHEEHQHLLPHVTALRDAGDAVGSASIGELRTIVSDALAFLRGHLIPHAVAEDEVLYPEVARLMGAPQATATMRRDHVEVLRLTEALGQLGERLETVEAVDAELARDLRRALYGLYAIVALHFAKEEEIYTPLLETGLDAERAARMFEEMHAHAHATDGA